MSGRHHARVVRRLVRFSVEGQAAMLNQTVRRPRFQTHAEDSGRVDAVTDQKGQQRQLAEDPEIAGGKELTQPQECCSERDGLRLRDTEASPRWQM